MVNGSYKKTSIGVERRKACGDCSGGMARVGDALYRSGARSVPPTPALARHYTGTRNPHPRLLRRLPLTHSTSPTPG
ncbi:unnamed protein product [Arctia plantaginis]|uniref:Uncharacterized protein n=1 Tax=Arctia plantaginis TaxID=874455 RepID=A0A8S1BIZ9_ARCPL|nr:unnamed protein product [Arctia plantaginis]